MLPFSIPWTARLAVVPLTATGLSVVPVKPLAVAAWYTVGPVLGTMVTAAKAVKLPEAVVAVTVPLPPLVGGAVSSPALVIVPTVVDQITPAQTAVCRRTGPGPPP